MNNPTFFFLFVLAPLIIVPYHINFTSEPTRLVCVCVCAKWLQSCPRPYDPMDCRLPGFSVHRILQARILEWAAMPSSRGSSQSRD